MGEHELREKYGGKLAKAINRAIRAEIAEGNAALDRLAALSGKANSAGPQTDDGKAPALKAFEQQKKLVAGLEAQIRQKWNIGPAKAEAPKARAKSARRPPRGAKRSK